jgi:hypothetical protein
MRLERGRVCFQSQTIGVILPVGSLGVTVNGHSVASPV